MLSSIALAAALIAADPTLKPFELKDGDRIVWLGNTLVEREQRYGYWETALYEAFPNATFTVRNLGWSGDTVWGESRGRFDRLAGGALEPELLLHDELIGLRQQFSVDRSTL